MPKNTFIFQKYTHRKFSSILFLKNILLENDLYFDQQYYKHYSTQKQLNILFYFIKYVNYEILVVCYVYQ